MPVFGDRIKKCAEALESLQRVIPSADMPVFGDGIKKCAEAYESLKQAISDGPVILPKETDDMTDFDDNSGSVPLSELYERDPSQGFLLFETVKQRIEIFVDQLDENHNVAIQVPNFPPITVESIGYHSPQIIRFTGRYTSSGVMVEIIQHLSVLNFLLTALPKQDLSTPPIKIGFFSRLN
jgi:hypothetical protein